MLNVDPNLIQTVNGTVLLGVVYTHVERYRKRSLSS